MLALFDEQAGGEVPDPRGVEARQRREVEVLEGLGLLERGPADSQRQALGLAAFDLVLEQDLEELEVAHLGLTGLFQADLQGIQKPAELEGLELANESGRDAHHHPPLPVAEKLSGG